MKPIKFKSLIGIYKYMFFDAISIILSYLLTMWMFNIMGINFTYDGLLLALAFIVPSKIVIYALVGIYRILTRHTGFEDIIRIVGAVIFTNLVIILFIFLANSSFMSESAYLFITLIEITLMIFPRILRRLRRVLAYQFKWLKSIGSRTLIIGAGSAGELVIKEIYKNKDLNNIPTAFVDDNKDKIGKKLMGVDIVGTLDDIPDVVRKYHIEEAILAIKELPKDKQTKIINELVNMHIKVKRLNILEEYAENQKPALVDIKVEDLLDREVIHLDNEGIEAFIKDEVVLVTGGGGSIGSELCRQIFALQPKKLVIFDIYENNAYDIQMELLRKSQKDHNIKYPELDVRIGSVYNKTRLEEIFKQFKPTVVFHAAAYKHVPLMEDSAVEAIRTNVLGTYNAALLSDKYNVKKFVLVSSDKAVRPTNVMGATKRFAELIIQHQQQNSKTVFSAVRFGNVLGSNGSVIPLFKKQIADGGPVTVTHKDITRYFMTIPEAVSLILQCGVYAKRGELFVLDMGEPVKIYELAKKMIKLAGFQPDVDIMIEVVGLRPGEKLYEELLVDDKTQNLAQTDNKKIFTETVDNKLPSIDNFEALIENLECLDNNEIKKKISEFIDTYQINGNGH
ncbi:polysaccharide biosynthesis protein [Acholeplasma equirhinis]|uniref:polysaccharide biosynthesis protein n=1 Tax=Acholeplasma equirhinis TaxID=555393 RepID=UPI00197A8EDF|nr:nucleoside-diphosphate sugar epimerase/dehydratase [Acholeplasma equirhinis]MBN3489961.1 polysaccharide biosynthesis protein [Acholeplasma equirhinis]